MHGERERDREKEREKRDRERQIVSYVKDPVYYREKERSILKLLKTLENLRKN